MPSSKSIFCLDIKEEFFTQQLLKHPPVSIPDAENPGFKRAAVLVPLVCIDGIWHLLLTRRTTTVESHKGQVSFPGGMMEPYDLQPEQTALRETFEEIGVLPESIKILGKLDDYATISDFIVTPIVGVLSWPLDFKISTGEVSRVFTIPLYWLVEPENHHEEDYRVVNGLAEKVVFFKLFDNEKLWGITARITIEFLKQMELYLD